MKLGLNSMVFCDCYTDAQLPWVETAARLGYQLLEVVVGDAAFDPDALAQALARHGLDCVLSCGIHTGNSLASPEAGVRAAGQAFLARCCRLAERLGSPTLAGPLFVSGLPPQPRSPQARQREWERVTRELKQAAQIAAGYGVTLCIEPLNRYKTDLINTVGQAVGMIDQVGADNLKILYDSYHANIEEADLLQSIRQAGSLLGEVHLCDNHKGPPGSGHIPFGPLLDALTSVGYRGPLIFESFLPGGKDNIWQPLAETPYRLAGQAIRSMRQLTNTGEAIG